MFFWFNTVRSTAMGHIFVWNIICSPLLAVRKKFINHAIIFLLGYTAYKILHEVWENIYVRDNKLMAEVNCK